MNRPTSPDLESVTINPGQASACLDLRNNSALAGCTKVDGDGQGRIFIARNWSQLSSGEERLRLVLQWLNGQASYPDLVDLKAHLDEGNYAAVLKALVA